MVHIHCKAEATEEGRGGERRTEGHVTGGEEIQVLSPVRDDLESFLIPVGVYHRAGARAQKGPLHPPIRPETGLTPNPQHCRSRGTAPQFQGDGSSEVIWSATLGTPALEDTTWS